MPLAVFCTTAFTTPAYYLLSYLYLVGTGVSKFMYVRLPFRNTDIHVCGFMNDGCLLATGELSACYVITE